MISYLMQLMVHTPNVEHHNQKIKEIILPLLSEGSNDVPLSLKIL